MDRAPDDAAVVDRRAMRKMTPVGERHGEELAAGRKDRHEGGKVGLGPGVGLHVGVLGAEQLPGPADRQSLDLIHDLAAAVIPALEGEDRRSMVAGRASAHLW